MAPAAPRHGAIQNEAGRPIANHLIEARPTCRVITEPGVQPRARGNFNPRVPDLAVTWIAWNLEDRLLPEPLSVMEILSPSNKADTWANVWTYVTNPSVREFVILYTAEIRIDMLVRDVDGSWPDNPVTLKAADTVRLEYIDFTSRSLRCIALRSRHRRTA